MNKIKPGIKTTEFYLNISKQVIGAAITYGFLTTDLGDAFANAFAAALVAAVTLISATVDVVNYVRERSALKKSS